MKWLAALLMALGTLVANAAPDDPVKVVYRMNEDVARAPQALRDIQKSQLIDDVVYVPSGAAEVSRLQAGTRT